MPTDVKPLTSHNHTRICPHCGNTIHYPYLSAYKLAESRGSGCKSCRSANNNKSERRNGTKENNPAWKGYKGVGNSWFSKYFARRQGSRRQKTGTITIEDAYNQLEQQNFKCALTGMDLSWSEDSGMSIDRIDSNKMYHKDNIQIVYKDVNIMKNKFDEQYFIEVCKMIVKHRGQHD